LSLHDLGTALPMPTYEYRCPKGHTFDVFQKMSDPPGAKCPECGKPAERMIVPGAGFLLKGEGFYITDYRSDDYKKKKASEGPETGGRTESKGGGDSGGGTSGAAGGGAESKPEPKVKKKDGSKQAKGGAE
jgi:putative FmdB family regulatory protein